MPAVSSTKVLCDHRLGPRNMRSYDKSIALYERTKTASGRRRQQQCALCQHAGAAVLRPRRGRAALRCRWQRPYRLCAGQRARDPGPCAQAGHRCGGAQPGRRPGLCRPASARDRAGRAALPPAARRRGRALRHLRHRGRADGDAARPRLHRPRQDPEVRGPLSWLERPGLYQRAAVAERGGAGRRAGAGRGLARHPGQRAAGRRGGRLERSRRARGRLRSSCRSRSRPSSWNR